MQRVTKKNLKMALPMLAAAAAGAWMDLPKAHADFIVECRTPGNGTSTTLTPYYTNITVTANGANNASYAGSQNPVVDSTSTPGPNFTEKVNIYVIEALNTGTNNTGSTLTVAEGIATTPGTGSAGALFVDTNVDFNGTGFNDADLTGQVDANTSGTNFFPETASSKAPAHAAGIGTFVSIANAGGNSSSSGGGGLGGTVLGPWVNSFVTAPDNENPQSEAATVLTTVAGDGNQATFLDGNFVDRPFTAFRFSRLCCRPTPPSPRPSRRAETAPSSSCRSSFQSARPRPSAASWPVNLAPRTSSPPVPVA